MVGVSYFFGEDEWVEGGLALGQGWSKVPETVPSRLVATAEWLRGWVF